MRTLRRRQLRAQKSISLPCEEAGLGIRRVFSAASKADVANGRVESISAIRQTWFQVCSEAEIDLTGGHDLPASALADWCPHGKLELMLNFLRSQFGRRRTG